MKSNYIKAWLFESYKMDESCVSAMQSTLDAFAASEIELNRLISTFATAAESRKSSVGEVIRLAESAPEGQVFLPPDWKTIRATALLLARDERAHSSRSIQ
jgi:hypothetical protein